MESDAVPFAVQKDGAVAVRTDRVLRLENFAAVLLNGGDRLVQAAVGVQIQERAFG